MAVLAVTATCKKKFSVHVHLIYSTYYSGEASLQLFCGNVSLSQTCIESEDSHV